MNGIFAIYNFGLLLIALCAFGLLRWWQIPAGTILDWAIGIGIIEWLFAIVTVPWNIYFAAKSTVREGEESRSQGITVEPRQLAYANTIASRSLIIAIALHLISAIALYYLSVHQITPLGYISSAAALLLTFLRPAISTYEYLAARLAAMRQQFVYPRADIIELRDRVDNIERQVNTLWNRLDINDEDSWLNEQEHRWTTNRDELAKITATIADLKAANDIAHQNLAQEAKQAISQITVDGQFLDRARELVRFIKTA
jgi:hypothetical protein